jgi:hypothetical protein
MKLGKKQLQTKVRHHHCKNVSEVRKDCERTSRLYGSRRLASANTARFIGYSLRAGDLLPVDSGVVCSLEPVAETELATRLESTGQLRASIATETTVLCTPTRSRCTPLGSASVEEAYTTAGDCKVKLASAYITSSVCSLYNHLLAGNGGRCERKP